MNRHQARAGAFALVFESLFSTQTVAEMAALAKETEAVALDAHAVALAEGVVEKRKELDEVIRPCLRNWTLDRISRPALAILEIAVYEIQYDEKVDAPIAINEAVELAKAYAADDDPSFINGVLGSIVREK